LCGNFWATRRWITLASLLNAAVGPGAPRANESNLRRAALSSQLSLVSLQQSKRALRSQSGLVFDAILEAGLRSRFGRTLETTNTAIPEITGPAIDQSHLHGLLGRIADLGLTLRSVIRLDTDP
jgi:hypothetical protein